MVRRTAARLGVDVRVEKVTDDAEIARLGIAATPGIVVDGRSLTPGDCPPRPSSRSGCATEAAAGPAFPFHPRSDPEPWPSSSITTPPAVPRATCWRSSRQPATSRP
ncbi:MAG: thioredoxin family protein [Rhodospirillales bacterium]